MEPNKSTIQRAFELARSGECKSIEEIKQRLKSEGYNPEMVGSPSLLMQLRTLIAGAKQLK